MWILFFSYSLYKNSFLAYFVCSDFTLSTRHLAINTQCTFVLKSLMCNLGQKYHMPQNGWLNMENPIKMDDLGGKTHYFRKPPFGHQLFRNQFTPRSPGILLSAAGQWIEGDHWFRSCMWQGTWDRISGNPKCRSSKKMLFVFLCVFFPKCFFAYGKPIEHSTWIFFKQKTTFFGYQVGFFSSRPVIVRNKNQSSSTIVLAILLMEVIRFTRWCW